MSLSKILLCLVGLSILELSTSVGAKYSLTQNEKTTSNSENFVSYDPWTEEIENSGGKTNRKGGAHKDLNFSFRDNPGHQPSFKDYESPEERKTSEREGLFNGGETFPHRHRHRKWAGQRKVANKEWYKNEKGIYR